MGIQILALNYWLVNGMGWGLAYENMQSCEIAPKRYNITIWGAHVIDSNHGPDFTATLPIVLLNICTRPRRKLKLSPYELLYGWPPHQL